MAKAKVESLQHNLTALKVELTKPTRVRLSEEVRVGDKTIHDERSREGIPQPATPPVGRWKRITSKGRPTTVKKSKKRLDSEGQKDTR